MAKRYYSKVSTWISVVLWGSLILMWVLCFPIYFTNNSLILKIFISIILGGSSYLMLGIFFNTYYLIEAGFVHWVTGPFRGKVQIATIREVVRPKSMMDVSGVMKPVLSSKPLLIKYNRYEDIPVSPEEEGEFLAELHRENSEIKIRIPE